MIAQITTMSDEIILDNNLIIICVSLVCLILLFWYLVACRYARVTRVEKSSDNCRYRM